MGFFGTAVGRRLIQRYGLLQAGRRALAIQVVLLGAATAIYAAFLSGPMPAAGLAAAGPPLAVVLFSAAVVTSRAGLWSYDMVNAQMFQQTVSPREVASASSAEMALCSLSELTMLGLAAYVVTPASYSLLVYGSFAAVVASNVLFGRWVAKTEEPGAAEAAGLPWAAAAAA
jgi:iron-regulated transporter 1